MYCEFLHSRDLSCMMDEENRVDEEHRVHFRVLEVSRSPEALVHSLKQQEKLEKCVELLIGAGHETKVRGLSAEVPKWFVEPSLVAPITKILEHNGVQIKDDKDTKDLKDDKVKDDKDTIILLLKDLKARHIIVSETYYPAVRRAIESVRKKEKMRMKRDVSCEGRADDVADDDSVCSFHTLESLDLGSVRELTFCLRELD